jgi:hypothetical protein
MRFAFPPYEISICPSQSGQTAATASAATTPPKKKAEPGEEEVEDYQAGVSKASV